MIVVTGGAGFIGSCIVRCLNEKGIDDIIIVDNIKSSEKWKNIANKKYVEYYNRDEFLRILPNIDEKITHIIHMGACSSTTEKDFEYLYGNNYNYTRELWKYCTEKQISFIYASSAATYGNGDFGFDDKKDIKDYLPLNGYGYSKQLFDLWAEKQESAPLQHVGLKFFNIYGPNEYFKGSMASVILHGYKSIKENGKISLFKSYNTNYSDGMQLRDFVYVKDVCKVIMYFIEHSELSGLYNVGTGKARAFYDLGKAVFSALDMESNIEFIEMPESLRAKYQYFTESKMQKLYDTGYAGDFYSLEEGVKDYVQNYLEKSSAIW
ncbi:MAG: ADP-glyceromanno-heptose 6-epimerase [Clostridiales bacterium]|nr:ADP-glyceromanno-heptose 6-epimerase [Clostridiales bacterium]